MNKIYVLMGLIVGLLTVDSDLYAYNEAKLSGEIILPVSRISAISGVDVDSNSEINK